MDVAFVALEKLSVLQEGYKKAFKVNGVDLLLIHHDDQTVLIENRCPHMDVPLVTGTLIYPSAIRCRAHGIEFNLKTGEAGGPLAGTLDCLKKYPLAYEGNQVGVDL
ncbi:Rieske (2Fe-2S) region [Saccharophagus degradans 2-40]|uniref:Rieske (2Fe-2S) region n=1 Tax=Saccharophagus degradans (strain 2-40 / ATCC 43961 / DSM 17024) TaxID=203122 RepID=Q21K47_SACD2|nr:Rieske (2Fe-2S) region [Saccharophagus degradans 2-40]